MTTIAPPLPVGVCGGADAPASHDDVGAAWLPSRTVGDMEVGAPAGGSDATPSAPLVRVGGEEFLSPSRSRDRGESATPFDAGRAGGGVSMLAEGASLAAVVPNPASGGGADGAATLPNGDGVGRPVIQGVDAGSGAAAVGGVDRAAADSDIGGRRRYRERNRDRDFIQFFADLGVTDRPNAPFLAGLLRDFRDAAARLDKHLAGYSACVHAAVSRLAPAASPSASPEHLWKRVHDRLGFFHDRDAHAQRLVNMGLSFAYRHLELDALAVANAHLLQDRRLKPDVAATVVLTDDVRRIPQSQLTSEAPVEAAAAGAAEAGAAAEAAAAAAAAAVVAAADSDSELPGGHLDDGDGSRQTIAAHAKQDAAPATLGAAVGQVGAGRGVDCSAFSGVRPPTGIPTAGGSADAGDPELEMEGTFQGLHNNQPGEGAASTMYERQPVLRPVGDALVAVKTALAPLVTRLDIDDASRQLFNDSLLLFARHYAARSGAYNDVSAMTIDNCWTVINKALMVWWPMWHAAGGGWSLPVDGTCAFKRKPGRQTQQSKWMYQVELTAMHEDLKKVTRPSTRYFNKQKLPSHATVERINGKDQPMLLVVVAAMLLLCTKEELFLSALTELSSTGVGRQSREQPLADAKCQSFFSAGLTVPTYGAAVQQGPAISQRALSLLAAASSPSSTRAGIATPDSFFPPADGEDLGDAYADMDAARARDRSDGARASRAQRAEMIKRKRQSVANGVDCSVAPSSAAARSPAASSPASTAGAGLDMRPAPPLSSAPVAQGSPANGTTIARPRPTAAAAASPSGTRAASSAAGRAARPPTPRKPRPSPPPRRRPAAGQAPSTSGARPPPSAPPAPPPSYPQVTSPSVGSDHPGTVEPRPKRARLDTPSPGVHSAGSTTGVALVPADLLQEGERCPLPPASQTLSAFDDLPLSQLPGGTLPSLSQFSASDVHGLAPTYRAELGDADPAPDTPSRGNGP